MRFNTRGLKSKQYINILSAIVAAVMSFFMLTGQVSAAGRERSLFSAVMAETGTARPSINGHLRVEGTQLVDENNEPVILKGISSHGLTWYPEFIDEKLFADLSEEWDCNLIRLAAYSSEYCNGYSQQTMDVLFQGIEAAIRADMYVLVDWHDMVDEDPNGSLDQAEEFFSAVMNRYENCPNLIYECCNEPGGDWSVIKDYCEKIISLIREKDPDASAVIAKRFRHSETFLAQYHLPYCQKRKVEKLHSMDCLAEIGQSFFHVFDPETEMPDRSGCLTGRSEIRRIFAVFTTHMLNCGILLQLCCESIEEVFYETIIYNR